MVHFQQQKGLTQRHLQKITQIVWINSVEHKTLLSFDGTLLQRWIQKSWQTIKEVIVKCKIVNNQ